MQVRANATPISPSHWVMKMQEEEHQEGKAILLGADILDEGLDFTFELRMSTDLAEHITQLYNEQLETEMKRSGQTLPQHMNVGQALMSIIQRALLAPK